MVGLVVVGGDAAMGLGGVGGACFKWSGFRIVMMDLGGGFGSGGWKFC